MALVDSAAADDDRLHDFHFEGLYVGIGCACFFLVLMAIQLLRAAPEEDNKDAEVDVEA